MDGYQPIILSRQMRSYARPRPIHRLPHQAGSRWIQANIGDRGKQMDLVHNNRSKPALTEMFRPSRPGIDEIRVAPVYFSHCQAETMAPPNALNA